MAFEGVEVAPAQEALARFREQQDAGAIDDFEMPAADGAGEVLDDEVMAFVQAQVAEHYKRWLDTPLPALKNKTPRKAAQDPRLRPKLAAMIRSMPDPMGMAEAGRESEVVSAPRQQLLAELELE